MIIAITSMGIAVPSYKRSQMEIAELVSNLLGLSSTEKKLLKSIYKATGIEHRYSVLSDYNKNPGQFTFFPNEQNNPFPSTADRMQVYKEQALPLAINAINNCIDNLKSFSKNIITHLITVSCTGMYAPGLDIEIVQTLNLRTTINRTAINFMGCYGAFNAIKFATAICKSDSTANVLVVCVELCTLHFQYKHTIENFISNALFADGAAAILIQANPDAKRYLSLENFYCDLVPQTSSDMAWHIGNYGFDIVLKSYVPQAIQAGISNFVDRLLIQADLSLDQIDYYAIHPGGPHILKACEAALKINKDQNKYAYDILRKYGNISSATLVFLLKAMTDDMNSLQDNKLIFCCAFGPGLTLESMLLKTHII